MDMTEAYCNSITKNSAGFIMIILPSENSIGLQVAERL